MGMYRYDYLPHYTYEDYLNWEGRWELIDGIPYAMSPAPMIRHQAVSHKIAWQLQVLLENCENCKALLPVDWKIDDSTIVQPDNLVICHDPDNEAYLTRAPSVIFEILSKSTALIDRNLKYDLYEKEGVAYYIIVDPQEEIAKVYKLRGGRYIKLLDAHKEKADFDLGECSFVFDFEKIW